MRDLEWSILWQRKSARREGGNACRKHTLGDFRFTKFSEVRQQLARKFEGRSKTDVRHLRIHREFIGDGTLRDHLWPTEATGDTSMEVFEVAQPMLPRRGCRTDSRFFSHRMLSLLGK